MFRRTLGVGRRSRLATSLVAGLALCGLAAAACTPGSEPTAEPAAELTESPAEGVPAKPDPSDLGDVTLVVWDQEVRGGQAAQIKKLNAEFEAKYPNITIKRVSRSFEDLKTTLRLALSGNQPPDVVQANNGRSDMGEFVKAGMLRPLDDYAEVYGWSARYPESVLAYSSYTPDGETFGDGSLYGLPQVGEVVGLFVNKSKLAELEVQPPGTWADFEAVLAKAKAAGEVPLQFGNLDQWPGIHVFGTVQGRYAEPDDVRKLAFGQAGASWETDANLEAAEKAVEWVDKGYFTEGFAGLGYDPAWQRFAKGKGVFLLTGTWLLADLQDAMGDGVGFMLPPGRSGAQPVATGGTGLPFAITQASENPEAAAAYVDFLTDSHAMQVLTAEGNLPVLDATEQQVESTLQQDVFATWAGVSSDNGLVPYLDYATPTFYDTLTAAIQDLLAKRSTPEEFLAELQQDYGDFTGSE